MKIFIISLATIVLIGVLAVIGYSIYRKNQTPEGTSESSPTLKVINYQIPAGEINVSLVRPAEIASSSGQPAAPQKPSSIPPQSVTPKPAVISQNYIKFYQDSISNLNKISPAMNDVQKTLVAIQQKSQSGNDDDLSPLISEGNSQNAVLAADISALKNSLDNWLLANNQTTNAAIKSKTNETISAGKSFTQSASDVATAISGILNYTGTGDPNQLSQQLQTAVQKVNDQGKTLVNLFTDLNKLLSNL